ncbi:hypothetical protein [Streptomyces roseifaciens]|uniref:hypothetical protein n=1 Tax=Streptomyces roseifaciens TaxID=1488406 RepID=UPI0007182913|nr:hypothetical protein [Streptomyces roseifaciens]
MALLDGMAIDGFTDFTVHGAVLINRRRLSATRSGLPGPGPTGSRSRPRSARGGPPTGHGLGAG